MVIMMASGIAQGRVRMMATAMATVQSSKMGAIFQIIG